MGLSKRSSPKFKCYPNPRSSLCAAAPLPGALTSVSLHGRVSGNLLHHVVEMYLKGVLAIDLALAELSALRHILPRIWIRIKQTFTDPRLNSFDMPIEVLHRFERIRYPDNMLKEGAQITLMRLRSHRPPPGPATVPRRAEPVYELVLEDVDELVKVIFDLANLNPKFFIGRLHNPNVLAVLNEDNQHAIFHV